MICLSLLARVAPSTLTALPLIPTRLSPAPTAQPPAVIPQASIQIPAGTIAIAKIDNSPGKPGNKSYISLIKSDGTELMEITEARRYFWDSNPAWSPDGTRIAYDSGSGVIPGYGIWMTNADGSGNKKITTNPINGFWPTWSPDGTRIAFTNINVSQDDCQIYLVNSDGSGLKKLTYGPYDLFPEWALDGTIFFIRRQGTSCNDPSGDVFAVKPDRIDLKQITKFGHVSGFGLSPDGKMIAYHDTETNQILVYPLDRSKPPRPIFDVNFSTYFVRPSWSLDGKTIAIAADGWGIDYGSRLYLVNADGTGSVQVPVGSGVWGPVWKPE